MPLTKSWLQWVDNILPPHLFCFRVSLVAKTLGLIIIFFIYVPCWELKQSVGSHGSSSLLLVTKVMVWHFVSDSHTVKTALIVVLAPNCCCWSLFCNDDFFSAFSNWCVIVHLLVDLTYENQCTIYLFLKVDFLWWESVSCVYEGCSRVQKEPVEQLRRIIQKVNAKFVWSDKPTGASCV
jgi:hypothetical protein